MALPFQSDVLLSEHTTLGLGGPARRFLRVDSVEMLQRALDSAEAQGPVLIVGGGSNLVVSDAGFDGLVIRLQMRGIASQGPGRIIVSAGEPWEAVVDYAVEREWAGVECLSGIPGLAGATPIQNVGAYGQDVSQVVVGVDALDLDLGQPVHVPASECGFAYRNSRFKRERGRWIVTAVHFELRPGAAPTVAYRELERALEGQERTIASVRETVVALRRRKSMVLDPDDPDSRSVGSFFTNPIVDASVAERVVQHAAKTGRAEAPGDVPRYDAEHGRIKFPAAWLIERAGVAKGTRRGGVAVSSKHTLALVHLGGGTTADLVALAREIRGRVRDEFGVTLEAEPRLVGVSL